MVIKNKVSGASSLERLVPDEIKPGESTGEETMRLHLERYHWAAGLIGEEVGIGRILDAACGVGYGTAILAKSNPGAEVVGVDINAAAVEYAQERYGASGAKYFSSDLLAIDELHCFDAITSLETIEHVPDPVTVVRKFSRLLDSDGVFILSVPVTPSVDVNPHHLTDFTAKSIKKLLHSENLEVIAEFKQIQTFSLIKILTKQESRVEDMRENLAYYYVRNPLSALKRAYSTLRFGFSNRYLTLACRKLS
jgi:2-polyprenyl-3-methyl-5-hydroxy-6-metoxy-1,4-benzoquinol methylase